MTPKGCDSWLCNPPAIREARAGASDTRACGNADACRLWEPAPGRSWVLALKGATP